MASLNPVFSVGNQIAEAIRIHLGMRRQAAWQQAIEMLRLVDISEPERRVRRVPTPTQWRDAPAGDDRDSPFLPTAALDCR